jgi:hypothetical protein
MSKRLSRKTLITNMIKPLTTDAVHSSSSLKRIEKASVGSNLFKNENK